MSQKKVPGMTILFSSKIQDFARELYDSYEEYKIDGISSSRLTQGEMLQWLQFLNGQSLFSISALGTSSEGREISLYTFGRGTTNVLLWSQMHGDEPTATMALGDIFHFLVKNPEHTITKAIHEKLTILAIPMLNPDGAERFTRRNAQMIDINRDALALSTPEAKILKAACDKFHPEYGFNLHDQDPRYTVGITKEITSIALLAPATDESHQDYPVRVRAKKVASMVARIMNLFIPGHIAKWDDIFCPTAFGDNIQKWGTSTVLIESGGWRGDPHKFFIRKLNCVGLLTALYAIALGEDNNADVAFYEQIPANMKLGCDHIIRNARFKMNGRTAPITVDIGINFDKRINSISGQIDDYATIVELGDLSFFTALENEVNANGAELDAERIRFEDPFPKVEMALLLKQASLK